MAQSAWGVADKCDELVSGEEGFDQLDRVLVFREISHRATAARIEDRVVIFLLHGR
jgi:hypothetical protein